MLTFISIFSILGMFCIDVLCFRRTFDIALLVVFQWVRNDFENNVFINVLFFYSRDNVFYICM